MSTLLKLDCNACKKEKSMSPAMISKMSPIVVFIGWIIALPSILGVFISGVLFVAVLNAHATVQTSSQAEAAGASLGAGLGIGMAIFLAIISLLGGLLGYILIMKKKVFKCGFCGFIIDRG
jgi:hypothetical protein